MKLWRQSTSFAPRRSGFDSRRLHFANQASVVSTASTRPLYGRGAGSTPAGGSSRPRAAPPTAGGAGLRRSLVPGTRGRNSSCGRSSTGRAPGRHPEVARSIRAVRFLVGLWCNSSMASSNLAGPGATPGGPALSIEVAGRSGSVISWQERRKPLRFEPAIRPRHMTATTLAAPGRSRSGSRLLIDRTRVRIPPGAFALR